MRKWREEGYCSSHRLSRNSIPERALLLPSVLVPVQARALRARPPDLPKVSQPPQRVGRPGTRRLGWEVEGQAATHNWSEKDLGLGN